MTGIVIRVIHSKGYAFVRGDEDGVSRYAHATWFIPELDFDTVREGQAVEFVPDDKGVQGNGKQAKQVRKVKRDN